MLWVRLIEFHYLWRPGCRYAVGLFSSIGILQINEKWFLYNIFNDFNFGSAKAENLKIESKTISVDKDNKLAVFKDEVVAQDDKKNILKAEYAEYSKELQVLTSRETS